VPQQNTGQPADNKMYTKPLERHEDIKKKNEEMNTRFNEMKDMENEMGIKKKLGA